MARLVTVDIKGFTDAQQAKILRALCRKDGALREKVAHMLQIAYGKRLSAAIPVLEEDHDEPGYQQRQPSRPSQDQNQTQQQNTRRLPEIPSRSSSSRRSGSDSSSTIPSRSTSASSAEPPCVEPTTTATTTTVTPARGSTASTTTAESTTPTPPPPASILRASVGGGGRIDSRTVGPHVPERVQEFEVREKWASARARVAAAAAADVNASMSRSQSVRAPKGPRARPGPGPGPGPAGAYVSDGERTSAANSPRRPTARENAQRYICGACEQVFTNQTNSSHSCRYHNGSLDLDLAASTWLDWDSTTDGLMDTSDNRSLFPDGFRWTCCNRSGSRAGCQRTSHRVDPRLTVR